VYTAHRVDAGKLHDAGPASRERTDGECPEDIAIESGEAAELRGERARIFRWDDTDETVRTDRPDPKGWISVISRQPAAHHKAGTGQAWIGSASGRYVDGPFGDDLGVPEQSQNESEDVAELQSAPDGYRRIGGASPDCSALVLRRTWVQGKAGCEKKWFLSLSLNNEHR
jgi:hypothetical protein